MRDTTCSEIMVLNAVVLHPRRAVIDNIVSNVSGVEAQTGRPPAKYGPTSP
jgi:hypothetical protein